MPRATTWGASASTSGSTRPPRAPAPAGRPAPGATSRNGARAGAALGLSRLPRLEDDIEKRRAHVRAYRQELADIPGLELPFDDAAVEAASHFAFVVLLEDRARRDAFREALAERGVQTTWYPALTSLSAYQREGATPVAEELAGRHCALPLSCTMSDETRREVVAAVRESLAVPA